MCCLRWLQRPRKKRKRDDDLNEFLPDRPPDGGELYGSLDFKEALDEEVCVLPWSLPARSQRGFLEPMVYAVCGQWAMRIMKYV